MTLFDRYLLVQFVKSLMIFFISLTGLYVVIDALGNLEEFITYGRSEGGFLRVLADYYGARTLTFFDQSSGVLTLIAAMFTVTWMQRQNEMAALLAAGIPKWRIVKPLVVAVAAVSILAALNREVGIPQVRHKLTRNAQDWLGDAAQPVHPRYDNHTEVFLNGRATYAADLRIEKPHFRLPSRLHPWGNQILAENAYYRPPEGDRPGGYLLEGVVQPANLAELPSLGDQRGTILYSPADTPWLSAGQCFVASDLTFEQLTAGQAWRQYSSTPALIAALRNPALGYGADVQVTIHARMVQPLLDVTLLFLGLPLVLRGERRNVFAAVGLCMVVVVAYFAVVLTCHSLGNNYLISPKLAAWCPAMIFVPLAVAMGEPLRE